MATLISRTLLPSARDVRVLVATWVIALLVPLLVFPFFWHVAATIPPLLFFFFISPFVCLRNSVSDFATNVW